MTGPIKIIGGDTIKFTFISSGDTFSPITSMIYTGSETLINSTPMSSSGNGHYYHNYVIPNTPGYYSQKGIGWVNSLPYIRKNCFKVIKGEVD